MLMGWPKPLGVFISLLVLTACSSAPRRDHPARLTADEAITLANASAIHEGVDLTEWHPPRTEFDLVAGECTWLVMYYSKDDTLMPGHFSVFVNDHTHRAVLHGGL